MWLRPADDPLAEPRLVSARQPGREYDVDEHDGILFIHTNDTSPNFRLATARIEAPGEWAELIPASPDFYMTDISNFKNFSVVEGRHSGLDQIEIRDYATNTPKRISFPEDSYTAGLDDNPEYDVQRMRTTHATMVNHDQSSSFSLTPGALK